MPAPTDNPKRKRPARVLGEVAGSPAKIVTARNQPGHVNCGGAPKLCSAIMEIAAPSAMGTVPSNASGMRVARTITSDMLGGLEMADAMSVWWKYCGKKMTSRAASDVANAEGLKT